MRVRTVLTTNQGTDPGRPTPGAHSSLSGRENDVLGLIAQGLTNKEIASRLGIAPSTVHQHTHHLLLKLRAANRTQLAIIALRRGVAREADSGPASAAGQAPASLGPIRNGGFGRGLFASRGESAPSRQAEPPRRAAERRERTLPGR